MEKRGKGVYRICVLTDDRQDMSVTHEHVLLPRFGSYVSCVSELQRGPVEIIRKNGDRMRGAGPTGLR